MKLNLSSVDNTRVINFLSKNILYNHKWSIISNLHIDSYAASKSQALLKQVHRSGPIWGIPGMDVPDQLRL